MKKSYIYPEISVMTFKTDDVITTSPIGIIESGDGDLDYLEFAFK